jgi:hypothetical protein
MPPRPRSNLGSRTRLFDSIGGNRHDVADYRRGSAQHRGFGAARAGGPNYPQRAVQRTLFQGGVSSDTGTLSAENSGRGSTLRIASML